MRDPAGLVRVAAPGLHVIGYRSNPSAIEIPADKFNQYLKEEGLDAVSRAESTPQRDARAGARDLLALRQEPGVSGATRGRRRAIGRSASRWSSSPNAIRMRMRADQDLPVRLTYENRPLAGALVVAINRLNPAEKLSARTDADGRVRFKLRRGGMWLIKAVHMVPAPAGRARRVGQLLGVAHVRDADRVRWYTNE